MTEEAAMTEDVRVTADMASMEPDGQAPDGQTEEWDIPDAVPVVIELDSTLSGGVVGDRFDVIIRGRVVTEAAIVEARLEVADNVVSVASFGDPANAPFALLPDGSPARQRSFQFNLPAQTAEPQEIAFQIFVRTMQDLEYEQDFALRLDPASNAPPVLLSGPARHLASAGTTLPPAVLRLERAIIDPDGVLTVTGWAVALSPVLAIQVYVGEERVGRARYGLGREDIAATYAVYPNSRQSGFTLSMPLQGADREATHARAHMACPLGFGHEETIPIERGLARLDRLPPPVEAAAPGQVPSVEPQERGTQSQRESPPPIHMYCDEARLTADGVLSINGWAVCAAGIAQIRVLVDGSRVGLATYGHDRPDVGQLFSEIPAAHLSGFKFNARISDSLDGEHEVRVIVRSILGNESESITPAVVSDQAAAAEVSTVAAPELTQAQVEEFKFELDSPVLSKGVAVETVTGRLTVNGWLLCRSGIASFEVFLDDRKLGDVHHGLARQDVGTAFPDWPNSLRSGYAFHCPPRSLRDGEHTVRVRIRSNNGLEIERSFGIVVKKAEDQQEQISIRRKVPRIETDMMMRLLADEAYRPSFRLILRQQGAADPALLTRTLETLRLQCYDEWSALVLADSAEAASETLAAISATVPQLADRFLAITPSDPAWTCPLATTPDGRSVLTALLLPGDELGADALLEFAIAGARNLLAGLIYGDELRSSPVNQENEPFFKPDFSPDLLTSCNYIGRPWVATAAVLSATGATPETLRAAGEYDLVLRCVEAAGEVHHVPKLLCQRTGTMLDDPEQEKLALERMMLRRGIAGTVLETPIAGTWRVRRSLTSAKKVSIIIPTCAAHGYIETCINSLRQRTAYTNYEIIVIDNIPATEATWKTWVKENADKVVDIPDAFNWSAFNNRAAAVASGDYFLFLNDDIEIIQEDWLDALLEHAQRPEVGLTGPQLLYRDGSVQHAGMFLANNGIGRHAFRFAAKDDPCYFGLALTQRNVMAVTGACMLVRKDVFEQLGGFEEAHEIVNNDLDFCLRAHQAGYLTVFTPYATLIHYELASRAYLKDVFDLTHFNAAWKTVFAAGDPYFSPRLWKHADDYRTDDEPVQWVVSGAPIFRKEEIQRILVVKLDHIGDFVTALQPIRRLKSLFPHARITVLAGKASRAFVPLEPSIDELITFDFYHARSQLGERKLTQDDFIALAEQLRPCRFDLAVDFRKHPSTRDVLKYTGARFLAGFDHQGQYPFLDIALDWDGDRTLQRKRNHIIDDLMMLVAAIERATETDRVLLQPSPAAMPLSELPEPVQALFSRRVVAVHPGAGNVTKQWPEEHFSALIDLLIEREDVNIMLVGGPDEVEVAERLSQTVLHPDRVASMAGKTSLADLVRLLKNCALYIGNDSGPKHIAAAVDIPTVGIHSGVVDPVEWGPLGPQAVALRRNMTCSPCYMEKADDCPRSLACLRFLEPAPVYMTAALLLSRSKSFPAASAETSPFDPAAAMNEPARVKPRAA